MKPPAPYRPATYVALLQYWTKGSVARVVLLGARCENGAAGNRRQPRSPKCRISYLFCMLKEFEFTGCDVSALRPVSNVPTAESM